MQSTKIGREINFKFIILSTNIAKTWFCYNIILQ
jgi:hypothetical protein